MRVPDSSLFISLPIMRKFYFNFLCIFVLVNTNLVREQITSLHHETLLFYMYIFFYKKIFSEYRFQSIITYDAVFRGYSFSNRFRFQLNHTLSVPHQSWHFVNVSGKKYVNTNTIKLDIRCLGQTQSCSVCSFD